MPIAGSVLTELWKYLIGGIGGWLLRVGEEWRFRKGLRHALYRELANNYEAVRHNAKNTPDFEWLRDNLKHQLAFHAYKKASGSPEAFYRIPEHGWIERCFKELEACTALPLEDKELMNQIGRTLSTIQNIDPMANAELFRSMLPTNYANEIK